MAGRFVWSRGSWRSRRVPFTIPESIQSRFKWFFSIRLVFNGFISCITSHSIFEICGSMFCRKRELLFKCNNSSLLLCTIMKTYDVLPLAIVSVFCHLRWYFPIKMFHCVIIFSYFIHSGWQQETCGQQRQIFLYDIFFICILKLVYLPCVPGQYFSFFNVVTVILFNVLFSRFVKKNVLLPVFFINLFY